MYQYVWALYTTLCRFYILFIKLSKVLEEITVILFRKRNLFLVKQAIVRSLNRIKDKNHAKQRP